jgi:GT2 family glycosyltransferase
VIVSYNRSQVLHDTLEMVFSLNGYSQERIDIVIVDQTKRHPEEIESIFFSWHEQGKINWIRLPEPNLVGAMNIGLLNASSEIALYLDDDIIPHKDLLTSHIQAHQDRPDVLAVIGQIIQPWQQTVDVNYEPKQGTLKSFMDFPFNSTRGRYVENAMAGNMSLKRAKAIKVGGFDERFIPPVAARFESEFAKRVIAQDEKIWFEPTASIEHLAVSSGGTRSKGSHLNSAKGYFGFGDYYFALRHGSTYEWIRYSLRRFFREVRTKYHLTHPWYIPVKWLGELRAFYQALKAVKKPPLFIQTRINKNQD